MNQSIELSTELFVPREVVFQAWSEKEHLKGWYPAPGEHLAFPDTERDSAWWLRSDGDRHEIEARHRVDAEPTDRLAWEIRLDTDGGVVETRVTAEFDGSGGVCRLRVTVDGVRDAAERTRQEARWRKRFERLENYFSAI
ncbi:MAG: hypothetical protein CMQ43_10760 [Gammaproteobacteria bacterium]|nr:hypothetical protein [Gammaproteobacteria bacterium]|tara:strand:+ start:963 stop:1382 length:420 start_codon:yes stop_codon:yes gene_type:complete